MTIRHLIAIIGLLLLQACASVHESGSPLLVLAEKTPQTANQYMGLPYRLGANPDRTSATDCSHLVSAITRNSLKESGYRFTPYYLNTIGIEEKTHPISMNEIKPGDLIFFKDSNKKASSNQTQGNHVGIITKMDQNAMQFVHASSTVGVTTTQNRSQSWNQYWQNRFHSFRRWNEEVFASEQSSP